MSTADSLDDHWPTPCWPCEATAARRRVAPASRSRVGRTVTRGERRRATRHRGSACPLLARLRACPCWSRVRAAAGFRARARRDSGEHGRIHRARAADGGDVDAGRARCGTPPPTPLNARARRRGGGQPARQIAYEQSLRPSADSPSVSGATLTSVDVVRARVERMPITVKRDRRRVPCQVGGRRATRTSANSTRPRESRRSRRSDHAPTGVPRDTTSPRIDVERPGRRTRRPRSPSSGRPRTAHMAPASTGRCRESRRLSIHRERPRFPLPTWSPDDPSKCRRR